MTRVVVVRVDDATPSDARDALRADLRRLDDAALATTETRYVDDADEGDADGFIGAPRVGASAARMCERASAVLRAGGTCALRLGAEARDAMILSGFVNVTLDEASGVARGVKPSWERGTAFALKTRAVRVNATDDDGWGGDGGDDDLIDENSLLTELDVNSTPAKYDDCDVGAGKKACKNCTCGRAEAEAAEEKAASAETFVSSCGNCALGDAFRCAGCPYLGQPAFKDKEMVGTKVELDLGDDL